MQIIKKIVPFVLIFILPSLFYYSSFPVNGLGDLLGLSNRLFIRIIYFSVLFIISLPLADIMFKRQFQGLTKFQKILRLLVVGYSITFSLEIINKYNFNDKSRFKSSYGFCATTFSPLFRNSLYEGLMTGIANNPSFRQLKPFFETEIACKITNYRISIEDSFFELCSQENNFANCFEELYAPKNSFTSTSFGLLASLDLISSMLFKLKNYLVVIKKENSESLKIQMMLSMLDAQVQLLKIYSSDPKNIAHDLENTYTSVMSEGAFRKMEALIKTITHTPVSRKTFKKNELDPRVAAWIDDINQNIMFLRDRLDSIVSVR